MRGRLPLGLVLLGVMLLGGPWAWGSARGQVIEERKGEANPAEVIFRSTLYGTGTGLVLGGAYALVENDPDLSTGEILRWSVAGGAALGFLTGLVYVLVRPEPGGEVAKAGLGHRSQMPPRLGPVQFLPVGSQEDPGLRWGVPKVALVRLSFR